MAKKETKKDPASSPDSATKDLQALGGLSFMARQDLNTVLFDNAMISKRSDDLVILGLFQMVPGADGDNKLRFEVFRGVTTAAHLTKLIDMICRTLNHYPTKPTTEAAS